MKFPLARLILPIVIMLLLDFYSFQAVKTLTANIGSSYRKSIHIIFWSLSAISIFSVLMIAFTDFEQWPKALRSYLLGGIFALYAGKLLVVPFLLIDDIIRGGRWLVDRFTQPDDVIAPEDDKITRLEFISRAALLVAGIPVVALAYGMAVGAYHYKIRTQKLKFRNLPPAFDGLRIVQISDLHSGSFVDNSPMERIVELIDAQKPDMIFFTGDLVNNLAEEIVPYIPILKKLKAPMGIYAVLGNHDYADYVQWESVEAKQENMRQLFSHYDTLGWKLLMNEHVKFERNGSHIVVAGVENWSAMSRFPKYGDLHKAMKDVNTESFSILLSHDPTHWDGQILSSGYNVNLTLSGHTHGAQFGIETPAFRWSPSQYIFKHWAGLYHKAEQYLYVNRGIGFIGYPGRAGIRPEIAVFELSHKA